MANCSIPNSTPATGRTSTTSSRQSKRLSSASSSFFEASSLAKAIGPWTLRFLNAQRSTPNAQHSIHTIERSTLGVGRPLAIHRSWTFFSFRRVKGAWWPSRSSKPSSPRKRRGRFDSYPLRHFKFDGRCLRSDFNFAGQALKSNINLQTSNICKGGESDVT
jgi:hypothetical protein